MSKCSLASIKGTCVCVLWQPVGGLINKVYVSKSSVEHGKGNEILNTKRFGISSAANHTLSLAATSNTANLIHHSHHHLHCIQRFIYQRNTPPPKKKEVVEGLEEEWSTLPPR